MINELYKFARDDETWEFTSADGDITYEGELYKAVPIGRSERVLEADLNKADIEINLSFNNPLAIDLLRSVNVRTLILTLFIQDDGDTFVGWKGRLASTTPEENTIQLTFSSIYTSLRRPGLGARYQKTCRHPLYGRGCNVNFNDHSTTTDIISASSDGKTFNVESLNGNEPSFFLGGMLRSGSGSFRWITSVNGNNLTVSQQFKELFNEVTNSGYGRNYGNFYGGKRPVQLFPGCNHTMTICRTRFNNLDNYGGFPFIPTENPMDGSSLL